MNSKVIQISTAYTTVNSGINSDSRYFVLTMLCEDGSVWKKEGECKPECIIQGVK